MKITRSEISPEEEEEIKDAIKNAKTIHIDFVDITIAFAIIAVIVFFITR